MMDTDSIAMPVVYGAGNANPRWERLTYNVIKDLMRTVKDNGIGSLYFRKYLMGTFTNYDMTPYDCRALATMLLTDAQFIIWESK